MNLSKEKLDEMEYFLTQSLKGQHLLFDPTSVAEILRKRRGADDFTLESVEKAQDLLNRFLNYPTFFDKMDFLKTLPEQDYELFVCAYFHIVENTILINNWKH